MEGPAEPDRRTRKRAARRNDLLDLALDLSERLGVEGVTMAALAEAADYAPASLYTYFPSRSALVAAMQQRALHTLGGLAESTLQAWELEAGARPRTLAWVTALNGGLQLDDLGIGVPTTGAALGHELTRALLHGWGAAPDALAAARSASDHWVAENV